MLDLIFIEYIGIYMAFSIRAILAVTIPLLVYGIVILRKNARQLSYCKSVGAVRFPVGQNRDKKLFPVLPLVSIKYTAFIIAAFILVLVIIQHMQPDYHIWTNEVLTRERMHNQMLGFMLAERYGYINDSSIYPLWRKANDSVEVTGAERNVLVISDSFGHFYGHADANQLFWKQLDKVLKQRGYHNINIYSVGTRGAATYDHMRWLRDTAMLDDLNPDIVIMLCLCQLVQA